MVEEIHAIMPNKKVAMFSLAGLIALCAGIVSLSAFIFAMKSDIERNASAVSYHERDHTEMIRRMELMEETVRGLTMIGNENIKQYAVLQSELSYIRSTLSELKRQQEEHGWRSADNSDPDDLRNFGPLVNEE